MFPIIAILFLVIPLVEIYFLIQVGQVIGAGWTIFLVVFTAVVGVWLLRIQGFSTLMRAQQKLNTGEMPAQEMLEGVGLVIAGALLLTPGFFTDGVGFFLLFPPTRIWLVSRMAAHMTVASTVHPQGRTQRKNDVIEGVNYRRED